MASSPFDEFTPDGLLPERWWDLTLGAGRKGQAEGLNLRDDPHILIVGGHDGEVRIVQQRLILSALSREHQVLVLTSKSGEPEFIRFDKWLTASASTEPDVIATIRRLDLELERRKSVLSAANMGTWTDLPPEILRAENMAPISVVVDDLPKHFRLASTPEWAEKVLPNEYVRLQKLNEAKSKSVARVGRIARDGRRFGIHLIVSAHSLDAQSFPSDVFNAATARVVLIGSYSLSRSVLFERAFGFSGEDFQRIIDEVDTALALPRGYALVSGVRRTPSLVQVAPVRSSDVTEILTSIGAPMATKWSL
jgi:hypothetical protein